MTPKLPKMPGGGGSFVRHPDGTLEKAAIATEPKPSKTSPEKPAAASKSAPVKEA